MLQQQERAALPPFAHERLSRSGKPETFGSNEDKWRLLAILFARQGEDRKTALRDIHTLLDLPQHVAFRLVRGLELGRLITVGACLHDAFAAELALTEDPQRWWHACWHAAEAQLTLSIGEMLAI